MVRILMITVPVVMGSLAFSGCFATPDEPDWERFSGGLVASPGDVETAMDTGLVSDSRTSETTEDEKDSQNAFPDSSEDVEIAEPAADSTTEDTAESVDDVLGSDTVEDPCVGKEASTLCNTVGAQECDVENGNQLKLCKDTGDGCPVWSLEFCPGNAICVEDECLCFPDCPVDGTCGGSDGCGGTCGCSNDEVCEFGTCVCVPKCFENVDYCGAGNDDGCGGTCPEACAPIPEDQVAGICKQRVCVNLPEDQKDCVTQNAENNTPCTDASGTAGFCDGGVCVP